MATALQSFPSNRGPISVAASRAMDQGLPDNPEAERYLLGACLSDSTALIRLLAKNVQASDFSLEKHKRIYLRMMDLQERGEKIDRVSLPNELQKNGQLQSVDGVSYIVSLDDGLPPLENLDGLINIVLEHSRQRRLVVLCQQAIGQVLAREESGSVLQSLEQGVLEMAVGKEENNLLQPVQIFERFPGGLNVFLDKHQQPKGIQTGLDKFDELTGGLREGELFILAARPAMGKSAMALQIAQQVAIHNANPKAVAFFSLEMSKESLLERMICSEAHVDMQRFRGGFLNHSERYALNEAAGLLSNAPIYIDDTAGTTLPEMFSKLQRLAQTEELGLVVVDYLQLVQATGRPGNREQEISSISRGLKIMSKQLKVPFLVLSQLSRKPEERLGDHRPMLSDLRESGSLEQDADLVGFIFREEVYRPDKECLKGMAELILAKQRNGPIGRAKLGWQGRYTRFENLAYDVCPEGLED